MNYIEMALSFIFSIFLFSLFLFLSIKLITYIIAYSMHYKQELHYKLSEIRAKKELLQKRINELIIEKTEG